MDMPYFAFATQRRLPPVKKAHFPPCAQGGKYGTVSIDIKAERQLRLQVRAATVGDDVLVSIDIKAERQLRHQAAGADARVPECVSIDIKAERQLRPRVVGAFHRPEPEAYQSTLKPKGN